MLISDDDDHDEGGDESYSQPVSRSVCGRTDACMGFVLCHNHHQFLLDHLLIFSPVIKSQAHLVQRQEILESASAAG